MRRFVVVGLLGLVVGLAGCSSGKAPSSGYINREGGRTVVSSDYESCVQTCNADFERCSDQGGSYMGTHGGGESQDATRIYGSASGCRDDLKKCLPRCKGR